MDRLRVHINELMIDDSPSLLADEAMNDEDTLSSDGTDGDLFNDSSDEGESMTDKQDDEIAKSQRSLGALETCRNMHSLMTDYFYSRRLYRRSNFWSRSDFVFLKEVTYESSVRDIQQRLEAVRILDPDTWKPEMKVDLWALWEEEEEEVSGDAARDRELRATEERLAKYRVKAGLPMSPAYDMACLAVSWRSYCGMLL